MPFSLPHRALLVALVCLALGLASCAVSPDQKFYPDPSLGGRNVVWVQPFVEYGPIQVNVRPTNAPMTKPRVVIFPFRMNQVIDKPLWVARDTTRLVWQTWLSEQVFTTLEYDETNDFRSVPESLRIASRKGADLAVVGSIDYLMDGGTVSDTMFGLRTDVYDVKSGVLVWSITHAGRMEAGKTDDMIIFQRKNRMPASPLFSVANFVAWQVGEPIKAWANSAPY